MLDFIVRVLVTIFSLGFVVIVHEWGHFLVARRLGVRVERFTVGFGPEIFGWTRGDTRYAVCALPLGGMVKMAGDLMEEHSHKPDEFFSQPWWGRGIIALAGPVMNYVLAFVLFAGVALIWGTMRPSSEPVIGDLVAGLPAAAAKLQAGDRVRTINGTAMTSWEQMAKVIHASPEKTLRVVVERPQEGKPAKQLNLSLTPLKDPQQGIGLIGVVPQVSKVRVGVVESLKISARDIKMWTVQPLQYLGQKIRKWEGPKELSGPVGIIQMVNKATKEGVAYVIYLMAIISTGLGLFNLFPIPILDGGHILLYTIEGLLRRPLGRRTLQVVNAGGLALILTIFFYASYQDILRWRIERNRPTSSSVESPSGQAK